jgi:cytochrome c biogenesis protein
VCGILALAGLLISFFMRRRRVFVRAVPAASGTGSVVTVGGLTRSDASGGFEDEFAELAAEIAAAEALNHGKPEPSNQSETGV